MLNEFYPVDRKKLKVTKQQGDILDAIKQWCFDFQELRQKLDPDSWLRRFTEGLNLRLRLDDLGFDRFVEDWKISIFHDPCYVFSVRVFIKFNYRSDILCTETKYADPLPTNQLLYRPQHCKSCGHDQGCMCPRPEPTKHTGNYIHPGSYVIHKPGWKPYHQPEVKLTLDLQIINIYGDGISGFKFWISTEENTDEYLTKAPTAITDEFGRIHLENIVPGTYWFILFKSGWRNSGWRWTLAKSEDWVITAEACLGIL